MIVSNQDGLQMKIRMTEGMKAALSSVAAANNRSMTGEILVAIEKHLASEGAAIAPSAAALPSLVTRLEAAIKALEEKA